MKCSLNLKLFKINYKRMNPMQGNCILHSELQEHLHLHEPFSDMENVTSGRFLSVRQRGVLHECSLQLYSDMTGHV